MIVRSLLFKHLYNVESVLGDKASYIINAELVTRNYIILSTLTGGYVYNIDSESIVGTAHNKSAIPYIKSILIKYEHKAKSNK